MLLNTPLSTKYIIYGIKPEIDILKGEIFSYPCRVYASFFKSVYLLFLVSALMGWSNFMVFLGRHSFQAIDTREELA